MKFTLTAESAKKGDRQSSNRITESGAYIGVLKRAEFFKAKTGTLGVSFDFLSKNEELATFNIYTHGATGAELFGYDLFIALMACASVKNAEPTTTMVKKYDYESKSEKVVEIQQFNELINKPIGLFLQAELTNYYDKEGVLRENTKMMLNGSFNAESLKTATEIMEKSEAKNHAKKVKWLSENPVKDARKISTNGGYSQTVPNSPQRGDSAVSVDDLDNDIPF